MTIGMLRSTSADGPPGGPHGAADAQPLDLTVGSSGSSIGVVSDDEPWQPTAAQYYRVARFCSPTSPGFRGIYIASYMPGSLDTFIPCCLVALMP